jgi:hypothetical protein
MSQKNDGISCSSISRYPAAQPPANHHLNSPNVKAYYLRTVGELFSVQTKLCLTVGFAVNVRGHVREKTCRRRVTADRNRDCAPFQRFRFPQWHARQLRIKVLRVSYCDSHVVFDCAYSCGKKPGGVMKNSTDIRQNGRPRVQVGSEEYERVPS